MKTYTVSKDAYVVILLNGSAIGANACAEGSTLMMSDGATPVEYDLTPTGLDEALGLNSFVVNGVDRGPLFAERLQNVTGFDENGRPVKG